MTFDPYASSRETTEGTVFSVTGGDWDSLVTEIGEAKEERIIVKSTGTVTKSVNSTLLGLARDVKELQGEASQGPVVITADRTIKYETVVKAMDTLQRAGVQRVGLAVQLVD